MSEHGFNQSYFFSWVLFEDCSFVIMYPFPDSNVITFNKTSLFAILLNDKLENKYDHN